LEPANLRSGDELASARRDLHRHAEPAWCEVRTAALVAARLSGLGIPIKIGREVVHSERLGLPEPSELDAAYRRALDQGADPRFAALVAGGFTGVVGIVAGSSPGPTVALRFDMDANYGREARDGQRASELGYISVNAGAHHNCGHDAHTVLGLALAERLALARDSGTLHGEVRLIFQPAEEGLRGGRAMVRTGVVDGVSYLLGCHIGVQALETGTIIAGYDNILASQKFDIHFTGRNAHAGISPHEGRNAIQAAAVAVQNLLAVSRHGAGDTRVNVGRIRGGESRNAVPATATIQAEVRADTNTILRHLLQQVDNVVNGAATICGVTARVEVVGGADAASSSADLVDVVASAAAASPLVTAVRRAADFKGSDDMSCFINEVQEHGGQAVYFGLGSHLSDFHHAPRFDIDDAALPIGVDVFWRCLEQIQLVVRR
jgi:aminobenzoyl-glutamate utilization protein A